MKTNFKWRQYSLFRNEWFEVEDEEDQETYNTAIQTAVDDLCFPSKVVMVLGKQRLQFESCPLISRFFLDPVGSLVSTLLVSGLWVTLFLNLWILWLKECMIERVYDWKGVRLEECKIGRV